MTASARTGACPPMGEAGRNVVANVEQLRKDLHLSLRQLSNRLGEAGRPILPSVLHRLLQGRRRVDADDLIALAAVFGVTPAELLAPPGEAAADPPPEHAAAAAARQLAVRIGELLEAAADPGAREFASGGVDRALRRTQIEVEDLLADVRREARRPA